MKRFLLISVLLTLSSAAHAATPGTIVVGGNELTTVDSLEVVNGQVFVKDIQVWPSVQRPSALRAELLQDTAPALTASVHEANMAARAIERQLHALGYTTSLVADSIAAYYRGCKLLVKDASVDPTSGQVWIVWLTGKREEWTLGTSFGNTAINSAASVANLWCQLLARGCTIYIGDGYELYVPERRSEVRSMLRQTMIHRQLMKATGSTSDAGVEQLGNKSSDLLRDLLNPQPLDSLRTRR